MAISLIERTTNNLSDRLLFPQGIAQFLMKLTKYVNSVCDILLN